MTNTPTNYRPATLLVQGGTQRSAFGETAEALFLTSGFVYDSADQAEATFAGTVTHYQYSRFGNPTVTMLEQRLAQLALRHLRVHGHRDQNADQAPAAKGYFDAHARLRRDLYLPFGHHRCPIVEHAAQRRVQRDLQDQCAAPEGWVW